MQSLELRLNEALAGIEERNKLITTLKRLLHKKTLAYAELQRDWQLKSAGLSPDSIARLHQAFATSTNNAGLKEAINVERKRTAASQR
ncbi:MAG: hypothetical protein WCF22_00555 [Candidatus Sulfotelmatobacter sp.]